MPRQNLAFFGEHILRFKLAPALVNTRFLGKVIADLWSTLDDLGPQCAGLAANQIHQDMSVCVIAKGRRVLINPKIIKTFGKVPSFESCYSIPGYSALVPRYKQITITFQDFVGSAKSLTTEDPKLSLVIQHEIDHLDGTLISDYVDHIFGKKGGILLDQCDTENETYKVYLKQLSNAVATA